MRKVHLLQPARLAPRTSIGYACGVTITLVNVSGRLSTDGARLVSALLKRAGHEVRNVALTRVEPLLYQQRELELLDPLLGGAGAFLLSVYSSYAVRAAQVTGWMHRRHPGVPVFLYGHSGGGILVLAYPVVRHPSIAGVISSGPGLQSQLETQKFKVLLTKILGKLIPSFSFPSGLVVHEICSDPKVVDAYINDPLVHTTITTGWGYAMLRCLAIANQNAPSFPFPLLLMHGGEDKLGFPSGSEAYAKLAPPEKITLKIWQGFKHEIHNEPERAQVYKFMIDWLNNQKS